MILVDSSHEDQGPPNHVVADGSGHYVQDDRPDIVINAIRDVIKGGWPRSN
jgi:hypothetical protein